VGEEMIVALGQKALIMALLVAAPTLGLSLLVGLLVGLFQATTQINEQTLAFVPKIAVVLLTVLIFGPWMYGMMKDFTLQLWAAIPELIR
jgi:flagellar biosynthetic protein FliQ